MRSFFLVIAFYCALHCVNSSPVITTSYGQLRGYDYTADDGTAAQIFKRIPFASAPVGKLRWKKPELPLSWNYTMDNTDFGPVCAQRTSKGPWTKYSEDCLYLNVYTSQRCRESAPQCAVLFIIHGGMGLFESTMRLPDETLTRNFVSQDIVVVSTAYRLTMFGAMALGDENVLPANLNMHDILAALRFTRNEIGHFGGDKEKITVLGHSYGGSLALLVAFSPERRAINGVVSMSGFGGLATQEQAVQSTHAVTRELGCEGSAREIMHCMALLDTEAILNAAYRVQGPDVDSKKTPSSITIAGELFPIANELEMRESMEPIRIMLGSTINEIPAGDLNPNEADFVYRVLGIVNREECRAKVARDRQAGLFDPPYNEGALEIVMSTHVHAKWQATIGGEAYLYEYGYPVHGAHTDDAYFVLGFHEFEMDDNERWLSRVYPRYFANFIKGGRPDENWSPVTPLLMNYFSVNRSIIEDIVPHMRYGYQKEIVQYYDDLVEYDKEISMEKKMALSSPVQYKRQNMYT